MAHKGTQSIVRVVLVYPYTWYVFGTNETGAMAHLDAPPLESKNKSPLL